MKRFLYSFLGTMAGIWLSVLLGGLLFIITISVIMTRDSGTTVEPHTILKINLSGNVVDREATESLLQALEENGNTQLSLTEIVNSIKWAADDSRIDGIYLECNGASAGLAQSQAIINAIETFRKSGKFVWAYSDNYTQGNYFIASAADSIFLNPVGMVDIHGLSAKTFFFKGLLDKIGVEVQVVKVGTYKSAVEPFILDGMSDANRLQQQHFLGRIWSAMTDSIAARRNVAPDSINAWADGFCFTREADYYVNQSIVDRLVYRREMDSMLAKATGNEKPVMIEYTDYHNAVKASHTGSGEKNIAVLYAVGDITESADDGIASDRLVPQILELMDNPSIDGLILRVNSGGGSAFASEQIWEALEQFKAVAKKPFYVSMGDMAASGGYYISCGADKIFAEPLTLTGSIGIFGMIPNIEPLLKDHLGVNSETVATNAGGLPDLLTPMTPEQRQAMQQYVDRGYELFVSRCAEGRDMPADSIKAIAEGRVWDGRSALENGLVDCLGGLDTAIDQMAQALGATAASVTISEYPVITPKWWQPLLDMDTDMSAMQSLSIPSAAIGHIRQINRLRHMYPVQCRTDVMIIR